MNLSASKVRIAAFVFLVPACLFAGYAFFSSRPPDDDILRQRMNAIIAMGWSRLHAENMSVVQGECTGKGGCEARFTYDLVLDDDGPTWSEEEKTRFARFLPMCAGMDMRRGARCRVGETMLFVDTPEYGWMPEPAVRLMPGNLARIAAWKKSAR
jgi:hypothetical protein